ncbi:MAG: ATP synthase F1 subunit delta [Planctomycetes bacterium]|nr:ATP synthase F1 subunit delta [Planctomycetota bacterium]
MKNETLSTVYAQALLELAVERRELERAHEEVSSLEKLLRDDARFRTFVESPKVERTAKVKSLEAALRGRVSDSLLNFVLLVIRKGRQLHLRQMLEDFHRLHDKHIGLVRVGAVTAVPLSEASRAELSRTLERKLGKRVSLEARVDPDVLGGLVVRYDGMVADSSLSTALAKIAAGMKTVKLGSHFVHENQP